MKPRPPSMTVHHVIRGLCAPRCICCPLPASILPLLPDPLLLGVDEEQGNVLFAVTTCQVKWCVSPRWTNIGPERRKRKSIRNPVINGQSCVIATIL